VSQFISTTTDINVAKKWAEKTNNQYLRDLCDDSELPEQHWFPEGFDRQEDVYKTRPDKGMRV